MKQDEQLKIITRAIRCVENKDYRGANKHIAKYIEKFPNGKQKAMVYYLAGRMHKEMRNYVVGYDCLLKVLALCGGTKSNAVKDLYNKACMELFLVCIELGKEKEAFYYGGQVFNNSASFNDKYTAFCGYIYALICSSCPSTTVQKEFAAIDNNLLSALNQMPCKELPLEHRKDVHKIHIAYISPDFRNHVMYNFYYALLEQHNREKFYVTCVYLKDKEDEYSKQVRSWADRFVKLPKKAYNDLAGRLRAMNIDIAVDLAGHTGGSGLYALAYRVAPVQISGLGWMESTGMKEVDYLITDRYMDEPGQSYITEKPLYLNSCFCFTPGKNKQDLPASTGAPCREKGYITFGSFNRLIKITDEMLMAWREIMRRVPNSKLLLKSLSFAHESTCKYTLDRMEKLGLDRERIILEGPSKDYMKRYLDVDIALDTYPYCGGGTTCDALYMGVPVVSLYGKRRSSNFGRSILSAAGLGELAVNNADEYVNLAVSLANDWDTLDMLHKNLRSMLEKSDLMNGEKYTRELEAQYEEIYRNMNKN